MNHLIINVAYVVDNQAIVDEMVEGLKATDAHFKLVDSNKFIDNESFEEHLLSEGCPCLLMISDNFLKSINSLKNGLNYLQRLIKKEQVIPIIIDGVTIDSEGNRHIIPTEFEKVSNVIRYMNYWQEEYLHLRKLKRTIPKEEEEVFAEKLKLVRSISSEVGEFLNKLRKTNYYTIEEFSNKHYEAFFRNFGDEATYLQFIAAQKNEFPSADTPKENETQREKSKPNFLPFEELLKEKEKLDISSNQEETKGNTTAIIESMPSNSLKNEEKEVGQQGDLSQYDKSLLINDPEWEKADYSEEQKESSLTQIAESEERPLTDTELLALELAEKLPISTEGGSEGENELSEEEMISLEDLLGKDLMEEAENIGELRLMEEKEPKIETKNTTKESEEKKNTNLDISKGDNDADSDKKTTKYDAEDDEEEEELEGYFVEEDAESEEIEEEIIEVEIIQSANTLIQSGKKREAISLIEETLKVAPEFVSLRYQYAVYLAEFNNNFKAASEQIAIVLKQEPNNLPAKFFLGELAEAERDYPRAKSYYESVFEEEEEFPNAAYKLGILLVNQLKESPDKAARYLEKAYQLNPNNINALYQLGLIQSENESTQELSIQSLNDVLEKAPEHPFANYDLALIYHKQGVKNKALAFYEKAVIINPELRTRVNDQAFAIADENTKLEAEKIGVVQLNDQELGIPSNQAGLATYESSNITETQETLEPIMKSEGFKDEGESKLLHDDLLPTVPDINKIVLITGATSGIGKATAIKFAKEGYKLILTGRRFSRLLQIKEQFEKNFDAKVKLLPFDIKNADAVQSALTGLEEEWQLVDILINNAGIARGESAIHLGELENWENMIDTNIKGLLYMTRVIAPFMVKRKEGQIINVCSLAGKEVYPNNAVYCATKHAVDALTKAMRIDLHKYNIKVSQVSPGFVEDTEFAKIKKGLPDNENSPFTDFVPVNAMDVAEVIYFIITQPKHVTLQEVVLAGTQQASSNFINRSGR